jgi:WhiB family redox-sensing transcriptional regulator
MMVNSYYGVYQAERGKTTGEIRAAGRVPGRTGRRMRADPSPLTTVPWPPEDGEQEVMAPMQWRDATVGWQDTKGLSLVLPCTEDPELFFAESPQDVEQAKAMCRGCRARLACLAGALERREPWGVWGGELLMSGAIVPRKRARGRPRKDVVTIGANA